MHTHPSAAAKPSEQPTARLPYLPGLDGLRALAVVAVLLAEWQQRGRIDLRGFWLRRARRLLPALFLMLAGTLAFARLLLPGEAAEIHTELLAALGYVMNWHLVLSQQSYFDSTVRPSLLQNLWSLAVEEQFYLLWPLLFSAGMRTLHSSGFLRATLAAAVASATLMATLYRPGADPSRLYYGTDTRAAGLLLGAALALVWMPGRTPAATSRSVGRLLDIAGTLALLGLIAAFVWLYEYHPLLYRGGFALVALGTAVVIAATTHPRSRLLPELLGWRPLGWVGLRSYGIYLWHWPVFMVTRPYLDVPFDGWPLLALRLTVVGALVELSYRFVELPVRHGAVERAWQAIWTRRRTPRSRQAWRPLHLHRLHLPTVAILIVSTTACTLPIEPQLPCPIPQRRRAPVCLWPPQGRRAPSRLSAWLKRCRPGLR